MNYAHPFDLEERLLDFSVEIIHTVNALENSRAGAHIGNQLIRSGTSALPNHGEAQAAESNKDFIHKMKIALKELKESYRWLRLIQKAQLCANNSSLESILNECHELVLIFSASIRTAERRKLGGSPNV